ncbi:MAG: hypothetical protein WDA21_00755 [Bacilli bacterium]
MKKIFSLILVFISIFILAGCSGKTTENDNEELQAEETTWNGPTTGPWEKWDRSNNGNQYFKYDIVYGNEDRTGWVTIDVKDLENGNYEFDVELTVYNYYSVGTSPTGETTYNKTANFVLSKKEGFFEATYDKSEMAGGIYEIIGRLDEQNGLVVDFNPNDIVWEEGKSISNATGYTTVNVKNKTEILGLSAYEVDLVYRDYEKRQYNYVINPDIKYPLSISETSEDGYTIYKITLVEYNFN